MGLANWARAARRAAGGLRSIELIKVIAMKMSSYLLLAGTLALSALTAYADPKSDVKDAIKKLGTQSNYSWTFTPKTDGSEAAARQGPIEGKTEKDGFTWFKGTVGDNSFEVAVKGSKYAVNYTGDWVAVSEDSEETARIAKRVKSLKDPIEAAEELTSKAGELKKDSDGAYSGDLTAEGAKELFSRLGRRAAAAQDAKGSVKFWVKNGLLTKYEFSVKGKMTVGEEKKEVDVSRTITVEIKDVGSTKLSLPEEATKKLS